MNLEILRLAENIRSMSSSDSVHPQEHYIDLTHFEVVGAHPPTPPKNVVKSLEIKAGKL